GGAFNALPFPGGAVTDIVLDPDDFKRAFVIDRNDVYMTTNAGADWTKITGFLPRKEIRDLRTIELVKTAGHEVLLVGGQGGVFRTIDPQFLSVWTEFGAGLPNVLVTDLHYIPPAANPAQGGDILVAGTLGRGAWTLASAKAQLDVTPVLQID